MKLVKMSLLAATLIASSAFAIDNVKVSGDAKLYYATDDIDNTDALGRHGDGLFSRATSSGQAALGLGLTADLTEGISAGTHLTAVSAMGLTNIVGNTWEAELSDEFWFDEAWLAGTLGKTTAKVGRMTLDTPLAFTETWSIAKNTFEAGVLINQDIPDTTIVGAYIGEDNSGGGAVATGRYAGVVDGFGGGIFNTNFGLTNGGKGAYTIGAINNSWTPMTIQGWFYNLPSTANAYWLQADFAFDMGLLLGGQFTGLDIKENVGASGDKSSNTTFAVMAGYEAKDVIKISAAYSQVGSDDKNGIGAGGNVFGTGQSKLYTEAWWNYGYITLDNTSSFNVTVTTPEALTWAELGLYYTSASRSETKNGATIVTAKNDLSEITFSASKTFGPLDTSLVYINTDSDDLNIKPGDTKGSSFNTIQAYLTYNF